MLSGLVSCWQRDLITHIIFLVFIGFMVMLISFFGLNPTPKVLKVEFPFKWHENSAKQQVASI